MSNTPAAIWTEHATTRLRQRFGLEVAQMAIHTPAIVSGAKFFGGRVAQVKIGSIYLECRWVEKSQAAFVITVHKGRTLRVSRQATKQNAKRSRGKLVARRNQWNEEE